MSAPRLSGCEQCGLSPKGTGTRRNSRERSLCCRMLLCGNCLMSNGRCFACRDPEQIALYERAEANERMREAAPDLLAACKRALGAFGPCEEDEEPHPSIKGAMDALRAAVSKAEGR